MWADGGYRGRLVETAKETFDMTLEIVKRPDEQSGFVVLPHRWIVERTFGWLEKWRGLGKDYEYFTQTSCWMILLALIAIMLSRLDA